MEIVVVIDVFRAFTTACVVLSKAPKDYYVTDRCSHVSRISKTLRDPILLGKPERGSDVSYLTYNSPTRVEELDLLNRSVIHRTTAGGRGLMSIKKADRIFAAAFVNADATVVAIQLLSPKKVGLMPMGHEGNQSSLEDDLCAQYIQGRLEGKRLNIKPFFSRLKEGPGKYFFGEDQEQYPQEDFDHCLALNRYDFAVVAVIDGDVARLSVSVLNSSDESKSSAK